MDRQSRHPSLGGVPFLMSCDLRLWPQQAVGPTMEATSA